jgi:CelD/BcsL family acetyltransferase involved in cellulose biosynthesis
MMHSEIIQEPSKIAAYRTQWEQLFNSGGYEASLSFEWTQALLKTHLGKDRFFLVVLKENTEIAGIVPLVIKEPKKYGFSLSAVSPIAEQYNTNSDLLFKNASPELVEVFVKALFSLPARWDVFWITRFVESNTLLGLLENCLKNVSIKYDTRWEDPSFYLNLDNTYYDFLKKRSAKFRNNLKLREKKLRAMGDVRFCKTENAQPLDEAFKHLLYIEENSWKHNHGTAITSVKKQRELYKELCESTSNTGWLHLCFLFLNNEPMSYNLGLVIREKYYSLKNSYHEKYKQVSPTTLLRAWVIEDLIKGGVKAYDFTGLPHQFESEWTKEFRWHKSLTIYNNTSKAKIFSLYRALKNKLSVGLGDDIVYCDTREFKPGKEV